MVNDTHTRRRRIAVYTTDECIPIRDSNRFTDLFWMNQFIIGKIG